MSNLSYEISKSDSIWTVEFSGDITEFLEEDLKDINLAPGVDLIFDFKGVLSVNSRGVKSWTKFITELSNGSIVFKNCPSAVVMMINYCPIAKGSAAIESIYGDFYCSNCDEDFQHLLPLNREIEEIKKECQNFKCEKCKDTLLFDNVEEVFFGFLEDKNEAS